MLYRSANDRRDAVEALTLQYVLGVITEDVFSASLRAHVDRDEARYLIQINQTAHRNSMAYRRRIANAG